MSAEVLGGGPVNGPATRCPKCGAAYGFLHSRPTYLPPDADETYPGQKDEPKGRLVWECGVCGYRTTTPTADEAPE